MSVPEFEDTSGDEVGAMTEATKATRMLEGADSGYSSETNSNSELFRVDFEIIDVIK